MIRVHHLNESRSQRILWMLEELALKYEIVPYQRDAATRLAPPELKRVHPLGKSPVIEENGRVVAESGASHAQVAIAWICAQPGIAAPIASATSVLQLAQLVAAVALKLDASQIERLNQAGQ